MLFSKNRIFLSFTAFLTSVIGSTASSSPSFIPKPGLYSCANEQQKAQTGRLYLREKSRFKGKIVYDFEYTAQTPALQFRVSKDLVFETVDSENAAQSPEYRCVEGGKHLIMNDAETDFDVSTLVLIETVLPNNDFAEIGLAMTDDGLGYLVKTMKNGVAWDPAAADICKLVPESKFVNRKLFLDFGKKE